MSDLRWSHYFIFGHIKPSLAVDGTCHTKPPFVPLDRQLLLRRPHCVGPSGTMMVNTSSTHAHPGHFYNTRHGLTQHCDTMTLIARTMRSDVRDERFSLPQQDGVELENLHLKHLATVPSGR